MRHYVTRALVIGYGSAGRRHARLLGDLGCSVAIVSGRAQDRLRRFDTIEEALAKHSPEYIVIANETALHAPTIETLRSAGYEGRLLVEKPLGALEPPNNLVGAAVGYNLRFHPVLAALAQAVRGQEILALNIYCGQYLPDWRPDRDYRTSYSADPARGGGVLHDLSHELDYLLWLGGDWRRLAAIGGRLGSLEIESDDCWGVLLELERCACATLQINYLDRPGRRQIHLVTAAETFHADLYGGFLTRNGETQQFTVGRDDTYLNQHKAILNGDKRNICGLAEGAQVMRLIEAIMAASFRSNWVRA